MSITFKFNKIVFAGLLLLFIYNSFGYLLLFFPVQNLIKYYVHKSIVEKKIDPKDLSILAFNLYDLQNNKYDFVWKKPGKEFRFNGKMYDIENKKLSSDTIYYTVYYDHKENILEEIFSIHQKDNQRNKSQNNTQRFILVGMYFEELKNSSTGTLKIPYYKMPLIKNEAGIKNYIQDVPTPPPRLNT